MIITVIAFRDISNALLSNNSKNNFLVTAFHVVL